MPDTPSSDVLERLRYLLQFTQFSDADRLTFVHAIATIERLSAERMQLREALSFYAQHWPSNSGELLDDQGRRARHAIGTLIENVDEHIAALSNTAENG